MREVPRASDRLRRPPRPGNPLRVPRKRIPLRDCIDLRLERVHRRRRRPAGGSLDGTVRAGEPGRPLWLACGGAARSDWPPVRSPVPLPTGPPVVAAPMLARMSTGRRRAATGGMAGAPALRRGGGRVRRRAGCGRGRPPCAAGACPTEIAASCGAPAWDSPQAPPFHRLRRLTDCGAGPLQLDHLRGGQVTPPTGDPDRRPHGASQCRGERLDTARRLRCRSG